MTLKLVDTKVSHVVMVHMVQWFMGVHQEPRPMVSSRSCRSHPGLLEQTGTRVSQGPGFTGAHLQPTVTAWGYWSLLGLLEPAGTRRSAWVPGSPQRAQYHGTCLWAGMLWFQFSSVTQSCATFCDRMDCNMPGFPVHHQLPEFTQTHVHWVGDAIQHLLLCCPLLLPPSIFPSIRVFSNESVHHIRWPKYWSLSFSISPSNEYSGLISFMMDWLDLLAI